MCYPFKNKACEEFSDKRKTISVAENKRKYVATNKDEDPVSLAKIDGCLIKKGIRCDYLLLNCQKQNAYFIELKGKHLVKATEQILRSIELLAPEIQNFRLNARIVLSRVQTPDLLSNEYKKLQNRVKQSGGTVQKQSRIVKENI